MTFFRKTSLFLLGGLIIAGACKFRDINDGHFTPSESRTDPIPSNLIIRKQVTGNTRVLKADIQPGNFELTEDNCGFGGGATTPAQPAQPQEPNAQATPQAQTGAAGKTIPIGITARYSVDSEAKKIITDIFIVPLPVNLVDPPLLRNKCYTLKVSELRFAMPPRDPNCKPGTDNSACAKSPGQPDPEPASQLRNVMVQEKPDFGGFESEVALDVKVLSKTSEELSDEASKDSQTDEPSDEQTETDVQSEERDQDESKQKPKAKVKPLQTSNEIARDNIIILEFDRPVPPQVVKDAVVICEVTIEVTEQRDRSTHSSVCYGLGGGHEINPDIYQVEGLAPVEGGRDQGLFVSSFQRYAAYAPNDLHEGNSYQIQIKNIDNGTGINLLTSPRFSISDALPQRTEEARRKLWDETAKALLEKNEKPPAEFSFIKAEQKSTQSSTTR